MSPGGPSRQTRRRLDTLRRRRDHLALRVREARRLAYVGKQFEFDRRELDALNWAIRLAERARDEGVLDDLTRLDYTTEGSTR